MSQHMIAKSPPVRLRTSGRSLPFERTTILTANGRTAIFLGLRALEMPKNAMVLMPEWHCGSEIDAVIAAGGNPVLYRLDDALVADLQDVAEKLRALRPWAIYCTHFFGYAQPLAELRRLADESGARLIEDLALGLLSTGGDPGIGYCGDMTVYSLVKTLPLADGGALWLREGGVRDRLTAPGINANLKGARSLLRRRRPSGAPLVDRFAHAKEEALDSWDASAGFDGKAAPRRATGLTRALLPWLDLDGIRTQHRANYNALWTLLLERPGVRPLLPVLPEQACPAFFPAFVADQARATALLAEAGIQSVRFWRRFHPHFGPESSAQLRDLRRHVLRLPIHTGVGEDGVMRIARALTGLAPDDA